MMVRQVGGSGFACFSGCICTGEEVLEHEGTTAGMRAAEELYRKGLISQREFQELVRADEAFQAAQNAHRLRPPPPPVVKPPPPPPLVSGRDRDPISLEPLGEHQYAFRFGKQAHRVATTAGVGAGMMGITTGGAQNGVVDNDFVVTSPEQQQSAQPPQQLPPPSLSSPSSLPPPPPLVHAGVSSSGTRAERASSVTGVDEVDLAMMEEEEGSGVELSQAEECLDGDHAGRMDTHPLPPCPPYPPSPRAGLASLGSGEHGESDEEGVVRRDDEEGVVRYNLETLVSYILATGDFLESTTRLPFTEEQLRDMDAQVEAAGLALESVVEAYRSDVYEARKTERSMVEGLENCVGGVVGEILAVVDQRSARVPRTRLRMRTDDGGNRLSGGLPMVPYMGNDTELQIRLVTKFQEFDHFFDQLKQVDAVLAKTCLKQYRALITGPPNCRTPPSPLLDAALTFISDKEAAMDTHSRDAQPPAQTD